MFPLRDDNPTYGRSVITFVLIGLNVLSWIFLQGFGFGFTHTNSVFEFGLIPGELLGAIEPGTRIPVGRGLTYVIEENRNWISLLSHMFMHGDWFHLIGNMWFLFVFGDNVEDALGSFKFLLFYLVCGLAAAAAQILAGPSSPYPMVGASGAIGGIMGAYAFLFPRAPVHMLVFFGFFFTRIVIPAFLMLGYWFVLQIFGGVFSAGTGGVAFWAHIGGFLAGIGIVKFLCDTHRLAHCQKRLGRTEKIFGRYVDFEDLR